MSSCFFIVCGKKVVILPHRTYKMSKTKKPSGDNAKKSGEIDRVGRICVPPDYFFYTGESKTEGISLYRSLHCPADAQGKNISSGNKSKFNLKKHMTVCK